MLLSGVLLLFFFSNQFIFNEISRVWENQIPALEASNEKFDVAIILGGITHFNEAKQQYTFHNSAERLFNVLPLYFSGRIDKILFTGGSGSLNQKTVEADVVYQYLLDVGVAKEDIILEKKSRNTYENAVFSIEQLPKNTNTILLSTSATHMPRALSIFHKQGIHPTPYPVNYESYEYDRFEFHKLFLPKPKVMDQWYWLIHEWVGILSYKLVGYC